MKRQHSDVSGPSIPLHKSPTPAIATTPSYYYSNLQQLITQGMTARDNFSVTQQYNSPSSSKKCGPKPGELDRLRYQIDALNAQLDVIKKQKQHTTTSTASSPAITQHKVLSTSTSRSASATASPVVSRQAKTLNQWLTYYTSAAHLPINIQLLQYYYQYTNANDTLKQPNSHTNLINELFNLSSSSTNTSAVDSTWLLMYLSSLAIGAGFAGQTDYALQTARVARILAGNADTVNFNNIFGLLLLAVFCIGLNMATQAQIYLSMALALLASDTNAGNKAALKPAESASLASLHKLLMSESGNLSKSIDATATAAFTLSFIRTSPAITPAPVRSSQSTPTSQAVQPPANAAVQPTLAQQHSGSSISAQSFASPAHSVIKPSLQPLKPKSAPAVAATPQPNKPMFDSSQMQILSSVMQQQQQLQPIMSVNANTPVMYAPTMYSMPQQSGLYGMIQPHQFNNAAPQQYGTVMNPPYNQIAPVSYAHHAPSMLNYSQYYTGSSTARDILSSNISMLPAMGNMPPHHMAQQSGMNMHPNTDIVQQPANPMAYQSGYYVLAPNK